MSNNHVNKKPLVLLIEQDKSQHVQIQENLQALNYQIIVASNCLQAYELLAQIVPDIILVDEIFCDVTDPVCIHEIRNIPHGNLIPIVVMLNQERIAMVKRLYQQGATDYVTKPVNWPIVEYRLSKLVNSSKTLTALLDHQAQLSTIHKLLKMGSWEKNFINNELTWSEELRYLLGINSNVRINSYADILTYIHPADHDYVANVIHQAHQDIKSYEINYRIVTHGNKVQYVREKCELLYDKDNIPYSMVGTIQDISAEHEAQQQISYLAYFDHLSNLPNRVYFKKLLYIAISEAQRLQQKFAVLFLDLDDFKRINDSLGHDAGDGLLKQVAERLASCLRAHDSVFGPEQVEESTVARLGGDEFTILLKNIRHTDDIKPIVERIIDTMNQPFQIELEEVFCSVSMGIVLYPEHGAVLEDLIKKADMAMYDAKAQGKNKYSFYTPSMKQKLLEKLSLEAQLRAAIANEKLQIYYQPKIDFKNKQIIGAEALSRWQDNDGEWIDPRDFIQLAEETNLILPISKAVLKTVCYQANQWIKMGFNNIVIAINLSSRQLYDQEFFLNAHQIIKNSGINPALLEFELTSKILTTCNATVLKNIISLKKLGVHIVIDDFGIDKFSFQQLLALPIDGLKIDNYFIQNLEKNPQAQAVIKAIIALARNLNFTVIAEGVENTHQMELLAQLGCHEMQGFVFSKPISDKDFTQLLLVQQNK
ncbi:MAG: EAL domain-containing protein [Gammaproteobacteria bacterium]